MGVKTQLTIEEYLKLEEPPCTRYELSQGKLIVTPSPILRHNLIRDRFNAKLAEFVHKCKLGIIVSEMDFKLTGDTVRRPDIAFVAAGRVNEENEDRVPLPLAPDLVIEIVSKNDRADDLHLKVAQYLAAGVRSVWLFYPNTRLAYRYTPGKLEPEVRSAGAGHLFDEPALLPGFSSPLREILP